MQDIEGMLIMLIVCIILGKIISLMCSGVGGFIIGIWASDKKG